MLLNWCEGIISDFHFSTVVLGLIKVHTELRNIGG